MPFCLPVCYISQWIEEEKKIIKQWGDFVAEFKYQNTVTVNTRV